MDILSIIILLIIAFLGWTQGMEWLFYGSLVLIVIASRSLGITFLIVAGVGAMYLLHLNEYWYVILIGIGIILILTKAVTEKSGGGDMGMYSPELMQLLGGGGYQ